MQSPLKAVLKAFKIKFSRLTGSVLRGCLVLLGCIYFQINIFRLKFKCLHNFSSLTNIKCYICILQTQSSFEALCKA